MSNVARLVVILSLSLFVAGCGDDTTAGSHGQVPTCELASKTELADENEVAPNGQTGAQILAAVPDSHHTSLNWNFSSSKTEVNFLKPEALAASTDKHIAMEFDGLFIEGAPHRLRRGLLRNP